MFVQIWGLEGVRMKRKMVDAAEQTSGRASKTLDTACPIKIRGTEVTQLLSL